MNGARRIAALPCGRWSKWAVLVFWVAVFAVAGPLAGKLNSAQQNDAADRAKAAADVRRFAAVNDVSGEVVGPIPAKDGRALQVVVPIKVAEEGNGWEQLGPRIKELRAIARADAGGLGVYVTGP